MGKKRFVRRGRPGSVGLGFLLQKEFVRIAL